MKRSQLDKFLIVRNGVWTFKRRVPGRKSPLQISLDTTDRTLARTKRDAILTKLAADELAEIRGPRAQRSTWGDVIAAYEKGIRTVTTIEERSRDKVISDARLFLRWANARLANGGWQMADGEFDHVLVREAMSGQTVRNFKAHYLAVAGEDRDAIAARRRGAEALLRNVRALFSRAAQSLYKALYLPPALLAEFLREARVECEERKHGTIEPAVLQAMDKAINAFRHLTPALSPIEAEREEQLWLVHALHTFGGLRNDEIKELRPEWFTRAPWGQVFIGVLRRPYFEPKQSEGFVPICAEVAALLAPFVQGLQPTDYVVLPKGPVTDRSDLVDRTHAAWMRQFLPAEKFAKAGYELRRWAAQVMELRHGRDAAENFLRHKRAGVAAAHYLDEWARWRRLGSDLGITLADARGENCGEVMGLWQSGAAALSTEDKGKQAKALGRG